MWLGITRHLAVSTLIPIACINFITHGVFSVKCKVAPWHLPPVTMLTHNQQMGKTPITQDFCNANPDDEHMSNAANSLGTRIARQFVLKQNTQHQALVTIASSGLFTIKHHRLRSSLEHVLSTRGIMKVPQDQPLYILTSNFKQRSMPTKAHVDSLCNHSSRCHTPP